MEQHHKPKLKFASSWDDGKDADFKLADILYKYNIPATFFIPNCAPIGESGVKILAGNPLFEIGGHTVTHPMDMKLLSREQIDYEVKENKEWLEVITGKAITAFCYPRGRYNADVIASLNNAGYKSARTTMVLRTRSDSPMQTHTAIHVFQRQEYGQVDWLQAANIMVRQAQKTDGIFHIWGHSWEVEKFGQWDKLEKFFDWLTENYQLSKE